MDQLPPQFIDDTQKVQITEREWQWMRSTIFTYADQHPLSHVPSQKRSWMTWYVAHPVLASVVAVILLVGTGVASAEYTVPGDLLYPIKVGVTEPIIKQLAISTEAKAYAHVTFANRRLREVEELAVTGTPDQEMVAELNQQFKVHADSVQSYIDAIETQDVGAAIAVGSTFESVIDAHEEVLSDVNESEGGALKIIVDEVALQGSRADKTNEENESRIINSEDQSGVHRIAHERFTATEETINELQTILSALAEDGQMHTEEERGLQRAQQLLERGRAELKANNPKKAIGWINRSSEIAREHIVLLEVQNDLAIDVINAEDSASETLEESEENDHIKPVNN
jgi:hypothetical protein